MSSSFYVVLHAVNNPNPSILKMIDGSTAEARKWAKTEGKKKLEPGDRLDIAKVVSVSTAVPGEIVLVETEKTEPEPASQATVATTEPGVTP